MYRKIYEEDILFCGRTILVFIFVITTVSTGEQQKNRILYRKIHDMYQYLDEHKSQHGGMWLCNLRK